MRNSIMSQICTIWFRTREQAGRSIRLYCFSFNHDLHKKSCLRSGIIMQKNKKTFCNGCSVRYEMRSSYLVCLFFWAVKVTFRMICKSVHPTMLILPHAVKPAHRCQLYCDLSQTNIGLFRVTFSLHIKPLRVSHSKLNQELSVHNTWLQLCCSQFRCLAFHLLRLHGRMWSTECRPLGNVHRDICRKCIT